MKKIKLKSRQQDRDALVEDEDFELVNKHSWFYCNGYASSYIGGYVNSKKKQTKMHRMIMDAPWNKEVDHVNGNKLDNRRSNLRICSMADNKKNKGFSKNNTSGFKGVSWSKTLNYWIASITVNRKVFVKYCKSKEEAAKKYNLMAMEHHGSFAKLNKI